MKNRKREKKKWASQPAARPKLASLASPIAAASQRARSSSRPAQLACNSPARGPARCSPARPSSSPTAAARWTPRVSRTPIYSVVFLTHASTAYATGARQWWQGGPGVTPGAWPCLLGAAPTQPLRRAYATAHEPLDANDHASTTRSPSAIGAQSLAIKPRLSVALALSCAPPPPCGHPQHTLAKREEGGEEEGGEGNTGAAAGRKTRRSPEPERATLHGTASGATWPRLFTAPLSSRPQYRR